MSEEQAYQNFRDHHQTGEKLFDRAVVAQDERRAQDTLRELHNNIAKDIMVLADKIAKFAPIIGTLLEQPHGQLDQLEQQGSAFVQMAHDIQKKFEDPALRARGNQPGTGTEALRKSFGNAWRPLVSEYANQVKVVFPTKVVCLSETCSETECGPEVAARDI